MFVFRPSRRRAAQWSTHALERRVMLAGDVPSDVALEATDATIDAPISSTADSSTVVVVDGGVDDIDGLLAQIDPRAEIILLDAKSEGIEEVTRALRDRTDVRSLHLITHGRSGMFQLGRQLVSEETIMSHSRDFAQWSHSFAEGADILLYGCETGQGTAGERLMQLLAEATGADIAGSTDRTGHSDLQGDWDFERQIGMVNSPVVVNIAGQREYRAILPITVHAAGTTGEEQMQLLIDGTVAQTWSNVGGDAGAGVYETFTYNVDGISADRIRVAFTNDLFDPANNIDRNLRVGHIVVDGVTLETEDPSVYSTATWLPADGIVPGYRGSEYLHANGYFQYEELVPGTGSTITVRAAGTTGAEAMQLQIDGTVVQSWTDVGTTLQDYTFVANQTVSADQIRVAFTNDLWDPDNGIDRNLVVGFVSIDGTIYQTEDPSVYSTATWLPSDGITPGYRQSDTLHANGYFQYSAGTGNPGVIGVQTPFLTVDEDAGSVPVSVLRTGGTDGVVMVDYATVGVTATPNADYTSTSGTLTFADGVSSQVVYVSLIDDLTDEPDERFDLVLSNVSNGATLGTPSTQITLVDNEPTPSSGTLQLAATAYNVDESAGSVSVTVERVDGSDGTVSVDFATSSGSATAGTDYTTTAQTVTFGTGVTSQTVSIPILDDVVSEPDESFSVSLSNVSGGAGLGLNQATVNIVDDDDGGPGPNAGVLTFDVGAIQVDEGAGTVTITVQRQTGSTGAVSVAYSTANMSALSGQDFVGRSGTLQFADGETQQQIVVEIVDDQIDEVTETFAVNLSSPAGGAELGSITQTVVSIIDNDVPNTDLLPDLMPITATLNQNRYVDTTTQPGRALLRISTEMANAGDGPLELWGGATSGSTQEVFQRIYQEDGSSRDVLAGEFVFHSSHSHIHFEGFAQYHLREVNPDGSVGDIVASGGKTSFCLINIRQPFPEISRDALVVHGRGGNSCGSIQGISTGYSDVYGSNLPDQWIDITDVPSGSYFLEVIADPDNSVREVDETNNVTRLQISVSNPFGI